MSFDKGGTYFMIEQQPHPPIPMDSIVGQSWPWFWNRSHSSCSLVGSVAAKGDGGPVWSLVLCLGLGLSPRLKTFHVRTSASPQPPGPLISTAPTPAKLWPCMGGEPAHTPLSVLKARLWTFDWIWMGGRGITHAFSLGWASDGCYLRLADRASSMTP